MSEIPPEIALAQFVLADERFSPGNDLKALVTRFASVEFTPIPFSADGISIKLKTPGSPHIIINSENPTTRQNFTLAHELGHVLIPWHVGTICSHVDADYDQGNEYYVQEGEANRFASELLVPTAWVRSLFEVAHDPAKVLREILDTVGVSPLAATIKLMHCLPPGFVCIEAYPGRTTQRHRSPGTVVSAPGDEQLSQYDDLADNRFRLDYRGYRYRWWFFSQDHKIPGETLERPWREALQEILQLVPTKDRAFVQQSLNGIISVAHQRHRGIDEAYCHILTRISGAGYAPYILDHPDFRPFVVARLKELSRGKNGRKI